MEKRGCSGRELILSHMGFLEGMTMEERQEKQERQQMEETGHVSGRIRDFIITLDGLVWGMVYSINAVVFRHSHSWKSWTDRGMNRRRDRWTDSVLLSVPRSTSDAHITAV